MGWHDWASWLASQAVSTTNLTKILDMLNYLKGKSGAIEIESDVRIGTGKSIRFRKTGAMIDVDIIGDGVTVPDLYFNFGKDVGSLSNKFRVNENGVLRVGDIPFARLSDFAANHGSKTGGVHGVPEGSSVESTSRKNQPNGYCGLNALGKVDDARIGILNCVRIMEYANQSGTKYTGGSYMEPTACALYADLKGNSARFCAQHHADGNHGIRFRNVTDNIVLAEHWHSAHAGWEWTDIWFSAPSEVKEYRLEFRGTGSLGPTLRCANLRSP